MIAFTAADYRAQLPDGGGRLMALDVGTKTIGLATCDTRWTYATAAETISRTKFTADLAILRAFATSHAIVGLVVGLPLNMDSSDSSRTQSVRAFARNLGTLGLPLLLWDERWSTVAVERVMIEADVSRAKRATRIDAHAAAHILQGAIDALVNLPEPS